MSQELQTDQNIKIKTQLLPNQWTLWFSYSCDKQSDVNYSNNLMQIQRIKSWNQFALLWKWACKIQNFFINPEDGSFMKFKFGVQERKIDSINFFRNDIQPQWEYGQNHKYGYFNFGVDRADGKINEKFQAAVFLGIGGSQQISKHIFGVRIVDLSSKPNHPSRARVQLWVDFRHDNSKQSLERLLNFQQKLQKYYKQSINSQINQIKFFNISNTEGEQTSTRQKQHNKRNQNQYKGQSKQSQYKSSYRNRNRQKQQN